MRAVVVGAGIAGVTAGRELVARGHRVTVLERSTSPGGRMATRRIGDARLDHGAQFFTVRSDELDRQVADWIARDLVHVWCHGFIDGGDGHPRYAASAGMASLCKDVARDLDVRLRSMVFAIRSGTAGARWDVVTDDGVVHPADAVVVTCPLPQASALLIDTGVDLPEELARTEYDRTLALLTVLDRPAAIPAPGGVQEGDPVFSFIADNVAKGISEAPAATFHARPDWSEREWDTDRDAVRGLLEQAAEPWLGEAAIVASQLKRWRFATPRQVWPERCWTSPDATIALAGDAFDGPRIESAYLSGLAAARSVCQM